MTAALCHLLFCRIFTVCIQLLLLSFFFTIDRTLYHTFIFHKIAENEALNNRENRESHRTPVLSKPMHAYDIMRKWNLKFSGTRREDPDAFLTRLDDGRSLVPIYVSDLLRVMPFFLSGIALNWFRSSKYLWRTYEDFARACRIRFSDPDFQFHLRQKIYRLTQGERESVSEYVTYMRALFDKSTPPLIESEEISYTHRNLLPKLHLTIHRADARSFHI